MRPPNAARSETVVWPRPRPPSNWVQKGSRHYAVLVGKEGAGAGIYRAFGPYSPVVGFPGTAPPGGRSGRDVDHLVFAEGTVSHSFQSVRLAEG